MKDLGVCVGSFIELKFYDFRNKLDSTNWNENPEEVASTELFYIDKIRWTRINRSFIDSVLNDELLKYFSYNGVIRTNYANLVVVNAQFPEGTSVTLTMDKLYKAKMHNFTPQSSSVGEFMIHDIGDWEKTISTMPEGFLDGRFYYNTGEIVT